MEDYSHLLKEVIKDGFSLSIDQEGKAHVLCSKPLHEIKFWFKSNKVIEEARRIEWEDEDLIIVLEWGFRDYSDKSPPVCTFLRHQRCVYDKPDEFHKAIRKEVEEGWFSETSKFPRTIPFRACPQSIEPKKEADEWKLIWNNRAPHGGNWESTIEESDGKRIAVATNGSTELPIEILFEWASI